jgi:catechol 2,3-dioxygenase-like lactoylglutathione lyase family enzyme
VRFVDDCRVVEESSGLRSALSYKVNGKGKGRSEGPGFGEPGLQNLKRRIRMENVIARLLDDFERGKMTRRQLIASIAVVAASAAGVTPAAAQGAKGFKGVAVNHISYQVNDYAKTRDFYAGLLGMRVVKDTGTQCNLILGDTDTFLIPRNAPAGVTPPRIDHVAYTIENWDKSAVEAELKRRGLNPTPDTENSFHVKDPNGFDVQISGKDMKPV